MCDWIAIHYSAHKILFPLLRKKIRMFSVNAPPPPTTTTDLTPPHTETPNWICEILGSVMF